MRAVSLLSSPILGVCMAWVWGEYSIPSQSDRGKTGQVRVVLV